jgi:hypothetical protein
MPWRSVSSIIYTNKKRAGQLNYPPLTDQSLDNLVLGFRIHKAIYNSTQTMSRRQRSLPSLSRDS